MHAAMLLLVSSLLATPDLSRMRTLFQTNVAYDPRVDLRADGVLVHNHGGSAQDTAAKIRSWSEAGYPVFRMFFADSDSGRIYTEGRWDGKKHADEAETRADGALIECAGARPYMIPTAGWVEFLKSLIREGLQAGATGVVPEEPLSHTAAGYSTAFKKAYEAKFGEEWKDPQSSPDAFLRHSWVLSDLYLEEIRELVGYVDEYSRKQGRESLVILPNHSVLSSAAGGMVFPNAAACAETGVDAFIGQVWTGPVGWSLGIYEGRQETRESGFFENAFLLYSSFANLTKGTALPMYFLIDPVEDDPKYQWEEYHTWYEQCIVACLLFPSVTRYEVMPWPDRIFLPGYGTGGGTPGPRKYLSELLAVGRALQEMEDQKETEWTGGTEGIGVLVSDTMGWERGGPLGESEGRPGDWRNFHGLVLPLIRKGIPVQVVPLERMGDADYAAGFRVLLLSYNLWKPLRAEYHSWLAEWVRRGGVLIFVGVRDAYDDARIWWKEEGYGTPRDHLLHALGADRTGGKQVTVHTGAPGLNEGAGAGTADESRSLSRYTEFRCGEGYLVLIEAPPYRFVEDENRASILGAVVRHVCSYLVRIPYREAPFWSLRRGRYVAAYAFDGSHTIPGPLVDVFDPKLPYLPQKAIPAREPALVYLPETPAEGKPAVLFHSGRLLEAAFGDREWVLRVAGPTGTNGAARIWAPGWKIESIAARGPAGEQLLRSREWDESGRTLLVRFEFIPQGTTITVRPELPEAVRK